MRKQLFLLVYWLYLVVTLNTHTCAKYHVSRTQGRVVYLSIFPRKEGWRIQYNNWKHENTTFWLFYTFLVFFFFVFCTPLSVVEASTSSIALFFAILICRVQLTCSRYHFTTNCWPMINLVRSQTKERNIRQQRPRQSWGNVWKLLEVIVCSDLL